MAVIRDTERGMAPTNRLWLTRLLARRPMKVAAIALADKMARMARAMMAEAKRDKEPSHSRRERHRAGVRHDVKVGTGEQHECRAGRSRDQDNHQRRAWSNVAT
jgi:hypothetical protein